MMIGAFQMKPHRICLRFFLSHSFVGDFTDYSEKCSFAFSCVALLYFSKVEIEQFSVSYMSLIFSNSINFFRFRSRKCLRRFTVSLSILSLRISFIHCTLPVGFWPEFYFHFSRQFSNLLIIFACIGFVPIFAYSSEQTRTHTHTNSI